MAKTSWILVAGTGHQFGLPHVTQWLAECIGGALAEAGFGLVVGGWHGVDYITAAAFEKALRKLRPTVPLSDMLIQVVPANNHPAFRGGHVIQVDAGPAEWVEAIRLCDAVVLLGGIGGTYETYVYALQERRAVFPVPATGGDASKVYSEMTQVWQASGIWGIGHKAFTNTLARSVRSLEEARAFAAGLVTLLVDHVSIYDSSRRRTGLFLSYAREDAQWLDTIKAHLRSVPATLWDDSDIEPGDLFDRRIHAALRNSIASILLVTPDFLASTYIREVEIPYLTGAATSGQSQLFWIHVRRADFRSSPLAAFQAVIPPEQALEELPPSQRQEVMSTASQRIAQHLRNALAPRAGA